MRIDRLQAERLQPKRPDPNAAAALREPLGGKSGAMPTNSNAASWDMDMATTTGNPIVDPSHSFHLECGARIRTLRVYETLTDPTGREVCGYLLVRGSVHAHAYALALKEVAGVEVEKIRPTPDIVLDKIPQRQKRLPDGSHRRLYTFGPKDYAEAAGAWSDDEVALPGQFEVVDGHPEGGKIPELDSDSGAFAPDYAPEETFEIASKPYEKSR